MNLWEYQKGRQMMRLKNLRRWKELWIEGNRTRLAGKMKQIVLPADQVKQNQAVNWEGRHLRGDL